MAQNPQEWARKLQQTLQQRGGRGGGPKLPGVGVFGGAVILFGGIFVVNNALFNGEQDSSLCSKITGTDPEQWMVAIEPSNTQG